MAKKLTIAEPILTEMAAASTHPDVQIGLDNSGSGVYAYVTAPVEWDRDRRLILDGVNYEHVADDADGCWLYRAM